MRKQCQDFATALLDHTRTSHELEILLNHDPTGPVYEHGERMHLNRLKLAIKLRQKKVSHLYTTAGVLKTVFELEQLEVVFRQYRSATIIQQYCSNNNKTLH